nr:MAG TPA: Protein of unknown function (DUF551) [Caudoviricetes sp.]
MTMAEYIERGSAMRTAHILRPEDKELMSAISIIPAVSVPQWISVKDRLPENKTRNIVLRYDHVTKTHFVDILWFCGNGWFCNPLGSGAEDKSISCWMPLPKPPKGENDG